MFVLFAEERSESLAAAPKATANRRDPDRLLADGGDLLLAFIRQLPEYPPLFTFIKLLNSLYF
jgi:hypothetical protein